MKKVTIEKYNKIMDKIIKKNKDKNPADSLIEIIEEAGKYEIIN